MEYPVPGFEQHPDSFGPLQHAFISNQPVPPDTYDDELVPNLRLNRHLVDHPSAPNSSRTPHEQDLLISASRRSSQASLNFVKRSVTPTIGSPASMFLGKLNTQFSRTTEPASPQIPTGSSKSSLGSTGSGLASSSYIGEYRLGAVIGTGGSSLVREAWKGDQLFAVKIVDKRRVVLPRLDYEREIWLKLQHPHILSLNEVVDTSSFLYLFCPLAQMGTMHNLVRRNRRNITPELSNKLKHYITQLVSAISYLHTEMKIVHGDIKLENCLLDDEKGGLLLCDFGLCHYIDDDIDEEFDRARFDSVGRNSLAGSWQASASFGASPATAAGSENTSWRDSSNSRSLIGISEQLCEEDSGHRGSIEWKATFNPIPTTPSTAKELRTPFGSYSGLISRKNSATSIRSLGLCRINSLGSQDNTAAGGSLHSAAPEQLNGGTLSTALDIWSLGVLVYAALVGKYPWHHSLAPKLRQMILSNDYEEPATLDDVSKHLISVCLSKDFMLRPSIEEVQELVQEWGV